MCIVNNPLDGLKKKNISDYIGRNPFDGLAQKPEEAKEQEEAIRRMQAKFTEISVVNGEFYRLTEIVQNVNGYLYKFVPGNYGKEIIYSSKNPIQGYVVGNSYILGFFPKDI